MNEQEVHQRSILYECGVACFRETSRRHIMGLNTDMMEMLFSIRTRRLVDVHIVGEGCDGADPHRHAAVPAGHVGSFH
jgi:pyruvate/2-oxoglutarate dehydrogenase complex dihydrolipoamide dehydrogenase (E3) component